MGLPVNVLDDHLSVVYVIAPDENGPCKIGVTSNLQRRVAALQTGCWLPLKVYAARIAFRRDASFTTIGGSAEAGAFKLEGLCHAALRDCDIHLHGEWFDLSASEAAKAISVVGKGVNVSALSIEDVLGLEVDENDRMTVRAHQQICAALIAANKFIANGFDLDEKQG